MPHPKDAEFLAALVERVQADHGEIPTMRAIIENTLQVVPDADHVSLTVQRRPGKYETLAATSTIAELLDRLQYELGEGPCVDALRDVDWYRSGDIGQDARWPGWGPQAADNGVHSLCSIPLLARGERVGALNMYAHAHDAFADRGTIDLASLYAVHVAYALASARQVSGLETAIDSRHTIGVAQGILVERFGLDVGSAFSLLQRISSAQNRRLREIARELVETGAIADSEIGRRRSANR